MDLQTTTPVEDFYMMGVLFGWLFIAAFIIDIVRGVMPVLLKWLSRHLTAALLWAIRQR